jgi:hypothetical protein
VLESNSVQTTARSYAPSAAAEQFPPRPVRVAAGARTHFAAHDRRTVGERDFDLLCGHDCGLRLRHGHPHFPEWKDEPLFPPAHADVAASFNWCTSKAAQIALTKLSPETLVWKIAAVVAYRSAGLPQDHAIKTSELPALFELFAAQLHQFPENPASYRAQVNEPELANDKRVLLVTAVSGGGKTAWASHSALHSGETIVYFDPVALPDTAVASSLLREVVAQVSARTSMDARNMVQPGASGLDGLRVVDVLAKDAAVTPIIVMDNVHTVAPSTIRTIIGAMGSCR